MARQIEQSGSLSQILVYVDLSVINYGALYY
jgi:hypothetical protein